MIIVFVGLRKGNCRNVTGEILQLVLRAVVKWLLGQLYQKRDTYMETLSQALPVNFEKKYEHGY